MRSGFKTIGRPKKSGSLIWKSWAGSESRDTLRATGSRELRSSSARAIVAPVPPTLTNVVKNPSAVVWGAAEHESQAAALVARYWRNTGATTVSRALSPLMPKLHRAVTRKA